MEFHFMNAAGSCKQLADVEKLARSAVTEITAGSITVEPRPGNSGNVFWDDGQGASLNSLGLPNGGLPYYREHLLKMAGVAHGGHKKLRVSIAPFSPDEVEPLAQLAAEHMVDSIEVNLSCPNVWKGKVQKSVVGFDAALSAAYLDLALKSAGVVRPVWAKVPPYSDPSQLAAMAEAVTDLDTRYAGRIGIVACNTFPNGFAFDHGPKPAITPNCGLAGVAGRAMKYIALGQVVQFRALLPPHIPVIGVGGIADGDDLADMLAVGAVGVQVNTAYTANGENLRVFTDILHRYVERTAPAVE